LLRNISKQSGIVPDDKFVFFNDSGTTTAGDVAVAVGSGVGVTVGVGMGVSVEVGKTSKVSETSEV